MRNRKLTLTREETTKVIAVLEGRDLVRRAQAICFAALALVILALVVTTSLISLREQSLRADVLTACSTPLADARTCVALIEELKR